MEFDLLVSNSLRQDDILGAKTFHLVELLRYLSRPISACLTHALALQTARPRSSDLLAVDVYAEALLRAVRGQKSDLQMTFGPPQPVAPGWADPRIPEGVGTDGLSEPTPGAASRYSNGLNAPHTASCSAARVAGPRSYSLISPPSR
jgi:hypothetical protein